MGELTRMDQLTEQKMFIFILFFVPGLISLRIWRLLVAAERIDFSTAFYEVLGYGAINFVVVFWLPTLIVGREFWSAHRQASIAYLLMGTLVLPTVWPLLVHRTRIGLSRHLVHPTGRAWDHFFGRREPCWVLIHRRDGSVAGGVFAGHSFASDGAGPRDLYLEQLWVVSDKGAFVSPVPASKGALFFEHDIAAIEFFEQ